MLFSMFTNFKVIKSISYVFHFYEYSHHNQRDNMEGSLLLVLFVAELDFPKILVPRLPHDTSNVNIESSGKSIKSALFM